MERTEAQGKALPAVPEDRARRNLTDPDSRIMPASDGKNFLQAYNCKAVVMIEEVIANTGNGPKEVSANAGYYSAVAQFRDLGADPFLAPERPTTVANRRPTARTHPQGTRTQGPDAAQVADQAGSAALRVERVEQVLGQIKQDRGFRQFLPRGLGKAQGEWSLIGTKRSLLMMFRFGRLAQGKSPQPHPHINSQLPGQHSTGWPD